MKKNLWILPCLLTCLTISGCAAKKLVEPYLPEEAPLDITKAPSQNGRVYMDELLGTIQDFDGISLTIRAEEENYTFDLSHATIETYHGLLRGDHISVIYEGKLSGTDTRMARALKVTEQMHYSTVPSEFVFHGRIQNISCNRLTLSGDDNQMVVFPLTGVRQNYTQGVKKDMEVYVHYLGDLPESLAGETVSTSNIKVLTVSDQEPYSLPAPTPTVTPIPPEGELGDYYMPQYLHGKVAGVSVGTLIFQPDDSLQSLHIDISEIPVYFVGGITPEEGVTIAFTGQRKTDTLDGMSVYQVTGDDLEHARPENITSLLTGEIIGLTTDTFTLHTEDNAIVTCRIPDLPAAVSANLFVGNGVRAVFDPISSRSSTILTTLSIRDL